MARKKKDIELSVSPGTYKLAGGDVTLGITVSNPVLTEQPRGTAQPRGVSSTDIQEAEPYFKAGMEVELQKFGKPEYGQLLLGEDSDIKSGDISLRLDLSDTQDRALHAIQKLLADTDYQGNLEGVEYHSADFRWRGYLPTLSMTYRDYYDAYGLKPAGDGRYHGAQAQQAIESLKSLMATRYQMIYDRTVYKGGKKSIEAIRVTAPIISSVGEAFQDITEEELEQVKAGQELPDRRNTKIIITPSPIMLDRIHEGWYLLKPASLHTEIQALYDGKRYPRAISLFIEWLLTLNKKDFKIGRDKLAVILRMDSLIRNRRRAEIDSRITEALEVAKELDYLLSYEIQPTGRIDMKLNPERIKRIKSRLSRGQKAEEETV